MTAQTELFGSTNAAGNERSRLEKGIQTLGALRDRAAASKNDLRVQQLSQQINSLEQELNTVADVERKANIRSDARNFFSGMPKGIQTRFSEEMKALEDPNADPIKVLRGVDVSSDERFRSKQASGIPSTSTLIKKAEGTFTKALSTENINKLEIS